MIVPSSTIAFDAKIPIIAFDVTDLPEPDSPTIHSVSPAAKSNDTPRTALTIPLSVENDIVKLFKSIGKKAKKKSSIIVRR